MPNVSRAAHSPFSRTVMQPSLPGFLGLAVLLVGTIAFEFTGEAIGDVSPSFPAMSEPQAALPVPKENRPTPVDGILARPLFAATRRPSPAPAISPPPPTSLPRLAGIFLNGRSRSAIFVTDGEARPLVVQEGAQVGRYTVQSIEAGQVTLSGPGAAQVLRPTFDSRLRNADSGAAAAKPVANDAATLASALNILQRQRDLPGHLGAATR